MAVFLMISLGFGAVPELHAGISYTLLVRSKAKDERSHIRRDQVHISADRMKIELAEGRTTVVDLQAGTFWTHHPDEKTLTTTTFKEMGERLAAFAPHELIDELPMHVEPLNPEISHGRCSQGYRVLRPDRVTLICVSDEVEGREEAEMFFRKLAGSTAGLPFFDRVSSIQAWRANDVSGFPIRTEDHLLHKGSPVWEEVSVAQDIRKRDLPDSVFQPPHTTLSHPR